MSDKTSPHAAPRPPVGAPTADSPEALLQRLEWTVLRRLDGLLQGDHRTLWRGAGLDLADLREYSPGDDVRHIDWNVTARLQQAHVRQYTEDRDLTAWFLIDRSASLDFGGDARDKRALSDAFVGAMARLLQRQGNRVGAMVCGRPWDDRGRTTGTVLPPRQGRGQVLRLLSELNRQAPAQGHPSATERARRRWGWRRPAAPVGRSQTPLQDWIRALDGMARRRALVFVVSDFISEPGWAEALGRMARRHDVLAVRVVDPLELSLPPLGLVMLQDAETGEVLEADCADPALRARHAELVRAHDDALFEAFGRAGVDALELATDDDLLTALLRCVALRRQRQGLPEPKRMPAALRRTGAPGDAHA